MYVIIVYLSFCGILQGHHLKRVASAVWPCLVVRYKRPVHSWTLDARRSQLRPGEDLRPRGHGGAAARHRLGLGRQPLGRLAAKAQPLSGSDRSGVEVVFSGSQLFSGTNSFPLFFGGGGCPTKNGLPRKGFPFFPFWGRCTNHFRSYVSGNWDVHWGICLGFAASAL